MFLIEIPEDGERPVFMAGDRVAVDRTAYGLRLSPMRWWGYMRWGTSPVPRGEWVAFNDPSAGGQDKRYIDERDVFVGFCYAVPGDSLWIDSLGKVYRNRPRDHRPCRVVELPRRNAYVTLTPDNMQWYCRMINLHEGARAQSLPIRFVCQGISCRVSVSATTIIGCRRLMSVTTPIHVLSGLCPTLILSAV